MSLTPSAWILKIQHAKRGCKSGPNKKHLFDNFQIFANFHIQENDLNANKAIFLQLGMFIHVIQGRKTAFNDALTAKTNLLSGWACVTIRIFECISRPALIDLASRTTRCFCGARVFVSCSSRAESTLSVTSQLARR
jgi:hypothetical protein